MNAEAGCSTWTRAASSTQGNSGCTNLHDQEQAWQEQPMMGSKSTYEQPSQEIDLLQQRPLLP